jgi:hypothetical protein
VYLRNGTAVPFVVRAQAGALATEMFAGIGVTLNLREAKPPASETAAIIIELVDRTLAPAVLCSRRNSDRCRLWRWLAVASHLSIE